MAMSKCMAGSSSAPEAHAVNARQTFERLVLPHLDAAYNLARWLLRDEPAADDAVQEASMRAFRYIDSLRGDDARPWLLGIVRNTCFTMLERQRNGPDTVEFDDAEFEAALGPAERGATDPAALLERQRTRVHVDAAIRALSPALREVIVLREFEDLEYAQIAKIIAVPIGTVMSRLSRARDKLRSALSQIQPGPLP
jgi:RNA polymerase sigma-70 factor (ECF subfamily)